eukprot:GFYU01000748.1.p1 GENE.GFYU01000748.1~~GFYU01000748.1.p1  ORF type:complete len:283 (-),score=92.67 GFYU01000748.1:432-1280(-)
MDSDNLYSSLNYISALGVTLSPEQRGALQASLPLLKINHKFTNLVFWGRVYAEREDYLVAQGWDKSAINEERQSFYSQNGITWGKLPPLKGKLINEYPDLQGMFTGDPSKRLYEAPPPAEGEEAPPPAEGEEAPVDENYLTEEDRLAYTVMIIDKDTCVVPRGAYIHNSKHEVVPNKLFSGLSEKDAMKLESYYHLGEPERLKAKPLMDRELLDKTIDFLDPLSEDGPYGCWSLQTDPAKSLVTLKNLLWPGYLFFYNISTRTHGQVYMGHGERNVDIAFML